MRFVHPAPPSIAPKIHFVNAARHWPLQILRAYNQAQDGDIIFVPADRFDLAQVALGAFRCKTPKKLRVMEIPIQLTPAASVLLQDMSQGRDDAIGMEERTLLNQEFALIVQGMPARARMRVMEGAWRAPLVRAA